MQFATRSIEVLPPELVPFEEEFIQWRQAKGGVIQQETSKRLTVSEIRGTLHRALTLLDTPELHTSTLPERVDDRAHDAYFGVRRVAGDRANAMVRAVYQARLYLVEKVMDPGTDDPEASWRLIDRALSCLLEALVGQSNPEELQATIAEAGTAPIVDPMTRWTGGHQIFAVLTQGLIFSMRCLAVALRAGDVEAATRHAELSINLLQGSAGTFRFTGEFLPEEYNEIVRPSMMPPATPMCLSGLMSVDHRFLVQQLREMRPALRLFRKQAPTLHDALAIALSEVYDAHIHVCERFVGERPSIRTAESTDKSGPALLQQFRNLRLKPFEHS